MVLQLTGRFNLLSCTADEACLKNKGVEQVRIEYVWQNTEVLYTAAGEDRLEANKLC